MQAQSHDNACPTSLAHAHAHTRMYTHTRTHAHARTHARTPSSFSLFFLAWALTLVALPKRQRARAPEHTVARGHETGDATLGH